MNKGIVHFLSCVAMRGDDYERRSVQVLVKSIGCVYVCEVRAWALSSLLIAPCREPWSAIAVIVTGVAGWGGDEWGRCAGKG